MRCSSCASKWMRGIAAAGVAAVGLLAYYYVFWVYPDDSRISGVDLKELGPISERFERVGTLFLTPFEHQLDIDAKAFEAAKGALEKAVPEFALLHSKRFSSPYQVYIPVGAYPVRLEAMDGIFVPAGATLTLKPKVAGRHSVRFFAVSAAGPARLEMKVAGRDVLGAALPALKVPASNAGNGFWQRNFARFLWVDLARSVDRWERQRVDAEFAVPTDELAIKCVAESGPGCVVSDVGLFKPAPPAKKNALVILVDTLRADGMASPAAKSMQALAARSTNYAKAIAAGNMTSPSTNAFLACRRPSDLGALAFSYSVDDKLRERYYSRREPSFPERFRAAGFETAMIGNVSVISEIYGVGVHHGFDRQIAAERDAYDTPDLAREAVEWLRDHGDHPFLLYLHFNGPHAPYRAPLADLRETWPGVGVFRDYPTILKWLYQSEISYADRYVGQVLEALKRLGLDESTEIVLTADHGDQHTARRFSPNAAGPTFEGAYFDHGATLLNDEIQVPLVVHEAGQTARRDVDAYVSTLDTAPTLLESFGISGGETCAGKPLRGDVSGRTFGTEAFTGRALFFDGRYKFIRLYEATDKLVFASGEFGGERRLYFQDRQLFDLATDPDEMHDLAPVDAGLLARSEVLYEQFYGVKDAYELVVDDPDQRPFTVTLAPGTVARSDRDDVAIETGADGVVKVSGQGRRSVVHLAAAPAAPPAVAIGGEPVGVSLTSMRLPLALALQELPREQSGRFTLREPSGRAEAFMRRVEDNGQDNRRLVTGNPRFEKVLREWGYLSDK